MCSHQLYNNDGDNQIHDYAQNMYTYAYNPQLDSFKKELKVLLFNQAFT